MTNQSEIPNLFNPSCKAATELYDELMKAECKGKLDESHGPALLVIKIHRKKTKKHDPTCFVVHH